MEPIDQARLDAIAAMVEEIKDDPAHFADPSFDKKTSLCGLEDNNPRGLWFSSMGMPSPNPERPRCTECVNKYLANQDHYDLLHAAHSLQAADSALSTKLAGMVHVAASLAEGATYNARMVAHRLRDQHNRLLAEHHAKTKTEPAPRKLRLGKTQILKEVLKGLDPYLSTGVPEVYWKLATDLTREIYGEPGIALLESGHKTYEPQFDHKDTTVLHSFEGWPDPNTQVLPEDLIKLLEALTPE